MRRLIGFGVFTILFLAALCFSTGAQTPAHAGAVSQTGILVKALTKDGHVFVGELKAETADSLTLADLNTGHDRSIPKDTILRLDRDISDDAAVAATDLPTVLLWKIDKTKVDDKPVIGKIARINDDVIYTTLSADRGLKIGSHVTVFRNEGEIKDPDTGKVLGVERTKMGELEITDVQSSYSKAKRLGDVEVKLQVGDEVEAPGFKLTIAVFPPVDANGNPTDSGTALSERLTTRLVSGNIDVVERSRFSAALAELSIQNTALFDPATAQKFGKQVGATAVLTGQIVARGANSSEVHIRLINVQTGKIILAASAPLEGTLVKGETNDKTSDAAPNNASGKSAGAITKLRANLPAFLTCNGTVSITKQGMLVPVGSFIRTKDGDFLNKDFTFDVWFIHDAKLPGGNIGIGSGINGGHATPVNSIYLCVHPLDNFQGAVEIMDREGFGATGIGHEMDAGTYIARIHKEGSAVTFSVGTEKDGVFTADVTKTYPDVQQSPDTFDDKNMHIFFGEGVFTQYRFVTGTASH